MSLLDRLWIRRRGLPSFSTVPRTVRRRIGHACRELTEAEREIAEKLGLPEPPRLLMVDEEVAVIVLPEDRDEIS